MNLIVILSESGSQAPGLLYPSLLSWSGRLRIRLPFLCRYGNPQPTVDFLLIFSVLSHGVHPRR